MAYTKIDPSGGPLSKRIKSKSTMGPGTHDCNLLTKAAANAEGDFILHFEDYKSKSLRIAMNERDLPEFLLRDELKFPLRVTITIEEVEGYAFMKHGDRYAIRDPGGEIITEYLPMEEALNLFIERGYTPSKFKVTQIKGYENESVSVSEKTESKT